MSQLNQYIAPKKLDKVGANPGAAEEKMPYLRVIDVRDIVTFPRLNSQTATYEGNLVLRPGAYPVELYQTPDQQEIGHTTEGDPDAMGINNSVKGSYPGNNRQVAAFVHNFLGQGVVLLRVMPNGDKQIIGSPGMPLYMGDEYASNSEKNTHAFTFSSSMRTNVPACYYDGAIPSGADVEVAADAVSVDADQGSFFRLKDSAGESAVTIASITGGEDGQVISLIGAYGSKVPKVEATDDIMLKGGTAWNAVEGSVLSLRAFDKGAGTLVWIEADRT